MIVGYACAICRQEYKPGVEFDEDRETPQSLDNCECNARWCCGDCRGWEPYKIEITSQDDLDWLKQQADRNLSFALEAEERGHWRIINAHLSRAIEYEKEANEYKLGVLSYSYV